MPLLVLNAWCCSFGFLRVGFVDIYYHANLFPIFDKVMNPKKSSPQCLTAAIPFLPSMLQVDETKKSQRGKPVF